MGTLRGESERADQTQTLFQPGEHCVLAVERILAKGHLKSRLVHAVVGGHHAINQPESYWCERASKGRGDELLSGAPERVRHGDLVVVIEHNRDERVAWHEGRVHAGLRNQREWNARGACV